MRVAVIGAGFSGIGAAVQLTRAGVTDLVVFERGDDVGGVWRANTYPGAACDVPSHLYSFSFAPAGGWSRRFAPQGEIHDYLRRTARELGVLPKVRLNTEVHKAAFDESKGIWRLRLTTGEEHEADVVIAACGQLSRPAIPRLPGLKDFPGTVFHSAEWDHSLDLTGRRVAVLGTGASAIQFVPEIAPQVAGLTVFQRSAPYVLPKPDRAYGRLARKAFDRPAVLSADRLRTYLVTESRSLGFNTEPRLLGLHARRFRKHLEKQVRDSTLRKALTPTDPLGCKRILQSNDWYPALQRSNVTLVPHEAVRVELRGVVTADGTLHEADTIIFGTGFTATELVAPMTVVGRQGTLKQAWSHGARAHLGTTVPGFPNLFLLYGPNTNLGHSSIILMLEAQIRYVVDAVRHLREGARLLEVRPEVLERFDAEVQRRMQGTVFAGGCRSWYVDANGRNSQNWPGTTLEFRLRTRRVRLADHVVTPDRSSPV